MATAEVEEKESGIVVAPFGIEADHPRNSDLLIQSIVGLRLRSRIDMSKPVKEVREDGEEIERIPDSQQSLSSMPKTPGMQLHVNPAKLTYVVYDPLREDEDLQKKVKRGLREASIISRDVEITGAEKKEGTLDKHRMKTLCRELRSLIQNGHARVVKGAEPDEQDVEELPGRFLLNPGARVTNTQPIFEDQWDEYLETYRFGGKQE